MLSRDSKQIECQVRMDTPQNGAKQLLSPTFLKCFNFTLNGGKTPAFWRHAIISVTTKVGKDKSACSKYTTSSILNL